MDFTSFVPCYALFIGIFFLCSTYQNLLRGNLKLRGGMEITRDEQPIRFWFFIILVSFLGGLVTIVGLTVIIMTFIIYIQD